MPDQAEQQAHQADAELRKCKRHEEKLAALLFRLRADLAAVGGDLRCLSTRAALLMPCIPADRPLPLRVFPVSLAGPVSLFGHN